jgi:spermidine dehydrogenase
MAESNKSRDRELGMSCPITRRDFLNGVAVGAGGVLASGWMPELLRAAENDLSAQDRPGYYPPALTGMRGSHPGSFETAHAVRDRTYNSGSPVDTGEKYDLIVVGGGISGLAAAYFHRKQAGSNSRILILDNHDDFGGHAKRNEFRTGGRLLLANGERSRSSLRSLTAPKPAGCSQNSASILPRSKPSARTALSIKA